MFFAKRKSRRKSEVSEEASVGLISSIEKGQEFQVCQSHRNLGMIPRESGFPFRKRPRDCVRFQMARWTNLGSLLPCRALPQLGGVTFNRQANPHAVFPSGYQTLSQGPNNTRYSRPKRPYALKNKQPNASAGPSNQTPRY